jgi:hypothetical protein
MLVNRLLEVFILAVIIGGPVTLLFRLLKRG